MSARVETKLNKKVVRYNVMNGECSNRLGYECCKVMNRDEQETKFGVVIGPAEIYQK
jgi:hypothetical protein